MEKTTGTLYRVEWNNPYTTPPDNAPRILAEMFVIGHPSRPPDEISSVLVSLGGGYCRSIRHVPYPTEPRKPEALASIRQKRLARRLTARYPLFAAEFAADELARKPAYYSGVTDPTIEAEKQKAIAQEWAEYQAILARAGQLVVYASEPEACRLRSEALRTEISRMWKPPCQK